MPIDPVDHVESAVKRLPAHHAREPWRKLLRVLLGKRGAWADGDPLWAVRSTTKGSIVLPEGELTTYFGGGGAATITGGGSTDFVADGRLLKVSALTSPPAFVLTPEAVDDAIAARDILLLAHDELNAQVFEEVKAGLSGAAWGIQELEGVFFELLGLRPLPVAAGEQLDRWGEVLNHARAGRSDADYRKALFLARRANATNSTIPEILDAAFEQQPETLFVQLMEASEAYYSVYLHGTAWDAARRRLLRSMHALGVGSDVTSAGGTLPFVFGPDGGWHVIKTVAALKYTIAGDVSAFFATDEVVRVFDIDSETVVHTTFVTGVTFVGPDTEVDVDDDGGVAAGTVLENVDRGVQDEIGGPFEDGYEIVGFTAAATFRVGGDATGEFTGGGAGVGELIEVIGSTGDDGVYRVTGVSFAAGETSLAVTPTPPAGSGDGQLQHAPPEYDPVLDGVRSPHGEFADVFVD